MRRLALLFALLGVPAVAVAQIRDLPIRHHTLEHGWLVLVIVPLLLLPFGRERP